MAGPDKLLRSGHSNSNPSSQGVNIMEIMQKIEQILDEQVRPMLEGHGGDAKLVDYADGVVWLEMQGACSGCPSADVTTRLFIEQTLQAALKGELDNFVLGYANPTEEYLETVCRWMKDRHGWDAKPEWILPEHGIVDAFFNAVKIFTKPGEGVMLMTPVYYPMYHAVKDNGRVLVDCPLVHCGDHYEIDFDDFERKAADENTKMLILCSPHNPTGRVWTLMELQFIAEICLKHHVLVISDEIHFDLVMPGHKHIVYANGRRHRGYKRRTYHRGGTGSPPSWR